MENQLGLMTYTVDGDKYAAYSLGILAQAYVIVNDFFSEIKVESTLLEKELLFFLAGILDGIFPEFRPAFRISIRFYEQLDNNVIMLSGGGSAISDRAYEIVELLHKNPMSSNLQTDISLDLLKYLESATTGDDDRLIWGQTNITKIISSVGRFKLIESIDDKF